MQVHLCKSCNYRLHHNLQYFYLCIFSYKFIDLALKAGKFLSFVFIVKQSVNFGAFSSTFYILSCVSLENYMRLVFLSYMKTQKNGNYFLFIHILLPKKQTDLGTSSRNMMYLSPFPSEGNYKSSPEISWNLDPN